MCKGKVNNDKAGNKSGFKIVVKKVHTAVRDE